jgi:hypothetical protein
MQVVHGRGDIFVAEQVAQGEYIEAVFQQMSGVGMAQGVHRDLLFDGGFAQSLAWRDLPVR